MKSIFLFVFLTLFSSCSSTKKNEAQCHPQNHCSNYQRIKFALPKELKWKEINISPPNIKSNNLKIYKNIFIVDQIPIKDLNYQKFEEYIYSKDTNALSILNQIIDSEKKLCKKITSKIDNQNKDEFLYEVQGEGCHTFISTNKSIFLIGKVFETNYSYMILQYQAEKNKGTQMSISTGENVIKESYIEDISKFGIGGSTAFIIFMNSLIETTIRTLK